LDEWVNVERFDFSTVHTKPSKKDEVNPRKMTRSRKKNTQEMTPHKEESEKLSALEKEHQEITKVINLCPSFSFLFLNHPSSP
jgi:hypothetical protein